MALLRAFIAIEIPQEIKKRIVSQTAELRQTVGRSVHWGADKNIHITLNFLGAISPTTVERLSEILKSEAAKHPTFELTIGGLGAFPNLRQPRIIWVGLNAPATLTELQKALETAIIPLGHLPEKRAFSPHLTIGRSRESLSNEETHSMQSALENTQIELSEKFTVKAIHLMQSELKPAGPVYTCLSTASLGG